MQNVIRILSYDPGLKHLGIAKSEYHIDTGKFNVLHRAQLNGDRALLRYKELQTVFPNRILQLEAIREEVIKNTKFKPHYVVTENAFHERGKTAAFIALIQIIYVIESTVMKELGLPLFKLPARSAKRLLTQYGAADKLTVRSAILDHEDIDIKETKANPVNEMTEHVADAIKIGYGFVKDVLPSKLCVSL